MCKVKWRNGKNGQMCKYTCVQIYKRRRIVSPPGGFAEALPGLANSHSPISTQQLFLHLYSYFVQLLVWSLVTALFPSILHCWSNIYVSFYSNFLSVFSLWFTYILLFPFNQLFMAFAVLSNCHPLYHFMHFHALFCQNSSRHVFVITSLLIWVC